MAMLLLIYGGSVIGLPRVDVVSMLGALIAPNKQDAVTLGGAIHFSMGVIFAMIYVALWSMGIGSPTWWWGLIFGAVHGLLLILLMLVAFQMIPQLSQLVNARSLMLTILLNHIAFGIIVALVYST